MEAMAITALNSSSVIAYSNISSIRDEKYFIPDALQYFAWDLFRYIWDYCLKLFFACQEFLMVNLIIFLERGWLCCCGQMKCTANASVRLS